MKPQNPSEKVAAAIYQRILTAANSPVQVYPSGTAG